MWAANFVNSLALLVVLRGGFLWKLLSAGRIVLDIRRACRAGEIMVLEPAQGACEEGITPQRVSYQPATSGPLTPAWIVAGCLGLLGLVAFVHLLLLYRA